MCEDRGGGSAEWGSTGAASAEWGSTAPPVPSGAGGSVSCRSARMGRGWRDLETVGAEGVGGGAGVFDGRRRPVDWSVAV